MVTHFLWSIQGRIGRMMESFKFSLPEIPGHFHLSL